MRRRDAPQAGYHLLQPFVILLRHGGKAFNPLEGA